MGITRLRGNTQVLAGTVTSTTVDDRTLIPQDFATWPYVPQSMTTAERDAIQDPEDGLTIFNTDTGATEYWNGTEWISNDPAALIAKMCVTESGELIVDNNGSIVSTL